MKQKQLKNNCIISQLFHPHNSYYPSKSMVFNMRSQNLVSCMTSLELHCGMSHFSLHVFIKLFPRGQHLLRNYFPTWQHFMSIHFGNPAS